MEGHADEADEAAGPDRRRGRRVEWLEEACARASEAAGVGEDYDGGEEEGEWEVHEFFGLKAEEVRDLVAPVLARGHAQALVTGKHEVTVRM